MSARWFDWLFPQRRDEKEKVAQRVEEKRSTDEHTAECHDRDDERSREMSEQTARLRAQLEYQRRRAEHYARHGTDLNDDLSAGRDNRGAGLHAPDA